MDKLWDSIEKIIFFLIYRIFRLKVTQITVERWCQFIKFGVVGLSNTVIYYVVYVILVTLSVSYIVAGFFGFFVSLINAYFLNSRYVFTQKEVRTRFQWKTFLKMFASYAGTGLILNSMLLILWVDIMGVHEMFAPVLNLFITIPLNYILNKLWAFRK